jgi:hypothetical protein
MDLLGRHFYYDNPLDETTARYPWHNCPCCVGNIPRTLLMIPTWTYVKGKDGIYVNLFIGSTINVERVAGTDVEMVQKTDYPWDGKVSITVNPKQAKKFSVNVRVPDRKTSVLYTSTPEVRGLKSFAVNGKAMTPKIENGYAVVTRDWKAGDRIEFEVPMEVQRIKSDEKIVTNEGLVALRYGPLIYNVERADQPSINGALGAGPLSTEWRGDLLEGVKVIKGTWADGSALTAVPHYARNNRLGQEAQRRTEIASGDGNVNYAPGSTAGAGTPASGGIGGGGQSGNSAGPLPAVASTTASPQPAGNRQGRGRFGESSSQVWIKGSP